MRLNNFIKEDCIMKVKKMLFNKFLSFAFVWIMIATFAVSVSMPGTSWAAKSATKATLQTTAPLPMVVPEKVGMSQERLKKIPSFVFKLKALG